MEDLSARLMDDEALAAEQQLSANLAAAATTLKYRAQATKTLLTLELIHADGELSAAHSASSYYAAQNSQLVAHCSDALRQCGVCALQRCELRTLLLDLQDDGA